MKITLIQSFSAPGMNFLPVGSVHDVDDAFGRHLCESGNAIAHETRIDPAPEVLKKKLSQSVRPVPASRKKTAKKRGKSAKK